MEQILVQKILQVLTVSRGIPPLFQMAPILLPQLPEMRQGIKEPLDP